MLWSKITYQLMYDYLKCKKYIDKDLMQIYGKITQ